MHIKNTELEMQKQALSSAHRVFTESSPSSMSYSRSDQTFDRGRLFVLNQNIYAAAIPPIALRLTAFFGSPYLSKKPQHR